MNIFERGNNILNWRNLKEIDCELVERRNYIIFIFVFIVVRVTCVLKEVYLCLVLGVWIEFDDLIFLILVLVYFF